MHFYKLIKELTQNKETLLFVDMDGVIANYGLGKPLDFANKRPLHTNINTLSKLNKLKNIELHILSVCKLNSQIKDKNDWLDKYAAFFDKDKRIILSKENSPFSSKELKLNYLESLTTNKQIIFIDDDNEILKTVYKNLKNVIVFQDSELVD